MTIFFSYRVFLVTKQRKKMEENALEFFLGLLKNVIFCIFKRIDQLQFGVYHEPKVQKIKLIQFFFYFWQNKKKF